ncbi:MAG TPA: FCD domain-containing protein [Pseudonocardia sp.]|nr:FCD domain-containing protein [Pseudonocardia sp.]
MAEDARLPRDVDESPAPRSPDGVRLTGEALGFPPMSVPKASDVLANHLRRQILDGELEEGALLPVERALVTSTGLSRGSVREALRILEIEGLIDIRPGRAGGSVVRRPGMSQVERTLDVFVRGRRIRLESLLEVREAIEPAAAALAAEQHTDDDLHRLTAANAKMRAEIDDIPAYLRHNVNWHLEIVRAGHNQLMHAFMSGLSEAIHAGTNITGFNSEEVREQALNAHDRVMEAIVARDGEEARRRMQRHVHAYRVAVGKSAHPDEIDLSEDS